MKNILFSTLICLFGFVNNSNTQPLVDIGLFENPVGSGILEIRVRPDGAFNQVYSASVFTIRWPAAAGLSLGPVVQVFPPIVYQTIIKSGPETTDGIYTYQIFSGSSSIPMSAIGAAWTASTEYSMMTISINGSPISGPFEIVNDSYTLANNGDHYQELNGLDKTGIIYDGAVLPIELIDFEAIPINSTDARLLWITASEIFSSHFEIERSQTGRGWKYIGRIEAAVNSAIPLQYTFIDKSVYDKSLGVNEFYYRLKMVDQDSSFEYTPIRTVKFKKDDPLINVYPNPARDFVQLDLANFDNLISMMPFEMKMFSVLGELVESATITNELSSIQLDNLQTGIYSIIVYDKKSEIIGKERLVIVK